MRILYVVHKYDYGQPERGFCYEHYNFYQSLVAMGHEVQYFDFPTLVDQLGRNGMNRRLLETVQSEKPDLMFTVVWGDSLDRTTVREISQNTGTVTVNWYCDDHWRFESLSRQWTSCFNWVVTTAQSALPKYEQAGYRNVIKSQWACNHGLYRRLDLPLKYDVTFVGLPHGARRATVQAIRDAGINVRTWGMGWEGGRLSQDQMIEVFNQSRINLNFSEASNDGRAISRFNAWAHRYVERPLLGLPGGWRVASMGRSLAAKVAGSSTRQTKAMPRQIKGRNFEVPGCGGFLMTGDADNLSDYYSDGKQVVVFDNDVDLIEKIRYYLSHEEERAAIAQAGHQRTLQEHTYARRFNDIFETIGLSDKAVGNEADRPAGVLTINSQQLAA